MNNFEIIIEEFSNQHEANKGVNEFIAECNESGVEIADITSHITESLTYVFIYKISYAVSSSNPRKKIWDDERW